MSELWKKGSILAKQKSRSLTKDFSSTHLDVSDDDQEDEIDQYVAGLRKRTGLSHIWGKTRSVKFEDNDEDELNLDLGVGKNMAGYNSDSDEELRQFIEGLSDSGHDIGSNSDGQEAEESYNPFRNVQVLSASLSDKVDVDKKRGVGSKPYLSGEPDDRYDLFQNVRTLPESLQDDLDVLGSPQGLSISSEHDRGEGSKGAFNYVLDFDDVDSHAETEIDYSESVLEELESAKERHNLTDIVLSSASLSKAHKSNDLSHRYMSRKYSDSRCSGEEKERHNSSRTKNQKQIRKSPDRIRSLVDSDLGSERGSITEQSVASLSTNSLISSGKKSYSRSKSKSGRFYSASKTATDKSYRFSSEESRSSSRKSRSRESKRDNTLSGQGSASKSDASSRQYSKKDVIHDKKRGSLSAIEIHPSKEIPFPQASSLARYTLTDKELDQLTNFSPALVSLNDIMKFHLHLTYQYIEDTRKLYESYSKLIKKDFKYTTIPKDEKSRKHVLRSKDRNCKEKVR